MAEASPHHPQSVHPPNYLTLANDSCFGEEDLTDDVIEGPRSLVIPEAANREISATVVLKRILEGLQ